MVSFVSPVMPRHTGVCGGSGAAFKSICLLGRLTVYVLEDLYKMIFTTTVMLSYKAGRLDCGDAAVYKDTKFSQPAPTRNP